MTKIEDYTIEATAILNILTKKIGRYLDGRKCILELRQRKSRNWKQMEWPGWYMEEIGRQALIKTIGGTKGPIYSNTQYDYRKKNVWDLKVHSIIQPELVLADPSAVYNGLGSFSFYHPVKQFLLI